MEKAKFIAKYLHSQSFITPDDASPFYDVLVSMPDDGRMLEIGTGCGDSTIFFSKLKPKWTIYTVDLWGLLPFSEVNEKWNPTVGDPPKVYSPNGNVAQVVERWEKNKVDNVVPIIANSADLHWELEIDALFIDGNHYYEGVKSDFEKFSPFVRKGGVVMFHDAILDSYYCQVGQFLENEVKKKMRVEIIGNTAIAYK